MPMRMYRYFQERGHTRLGSAVLAFLKVFAYAIVTALVTLTLALFSSKASSQLAHRVDVNTAKTRMLIENSASNRTDEHAVFLCLLTQTPAGNGAWTEQQVRECAVANGTEPNFNTP